MYSQIDVYNSELRKMTTEKLVLELTGKQITTQKTVGFRKCSKINLKL